MLIIIKAVPSILFVLYLARIAHQIVYNCKMSCSIGALKLLFINNNNNTNNLYSANQYHNNYIKYNYLPKYSILVTAIA